MEFDILPVTRFQQNCSILWCENTRRAAIIDPGGDIDQLKDFLTWEKLALEVVLPGLEVVDPGLDRKLVGARAQGLEAAPPAVVDGRGHGRLAPG